ncbi:MAG: 4-(cytidine 5'-diphospho)-2-C-methyl-D-erythritol kinase [Pseudolabrys sp.]|nr:4-(cytidine 5'-diphospho)-2-C-methyl-D-erythritol kinase [Pseudolabrys sp.]MDP2295836.1 4-(cytidine 5'-diphospho)-2-C-methyl-D-erythritol kinase [Pseudolabrys sp.]
MIESARAKINLTLRVLGRRADFYHDLESLVVFADLADTLTLEPGDGTSLDIGGPYAAQAGLTEDNLVLKALRALADSTGGSALRGGHFTLDKQLPVAAGIGGGSADAAAALRLIARANDMPFDDARLMLAALRTGADVPVCMASRPRIMTGVGERLSQPLDLPPLNAILVNPGVPLATRDVFAAYQVRPQAHALAPQAVPREVGPLIEFLKGHGNDLTAAAIACAPVVGDVLDALQAASGSLLARMSGSGSTSFALFESAGEAKAAASHLAAAHEGWWVMPAVFGDRS